MRPPCASSLPVLVMAPPPKPRLIAALGSAVEPLVHTPEAIDSARISGISVVDDAILERERAHAWPLANVRRRVRSAHSRELRRSIGRRARDLYSFLSASQQW